MRGGDNTGRVISTALRFIDGFTRPSSDAIRNMQRMGREFQKTGRQIQNAGKSISNIGSSVAKSVTLPVVGIGAAAVKTAADFESAMSEVGAISGASGENMKKLTAKAKEMGATTSFSASESAEAMKYMAMAGWKTKDMTEGIAGVMNLAAASGENLGKASDIVTDGLTAFNMKAKDSSRFADVMAAASSNANTNVSMMGESFKYCASTAGAMGYKVEDISVALGVMANAGIKGSTAGTTLKNVIANMSKPTDTQAGVMKKLGISLTDNNGKTKSFAEVMNNLRSSFAGLSETEKASAAATLAGKQSMSGLLTIVNASDKDFNKLTKSINGSSGAAKKMADKMLDNLNGQITLLKSAIEGILITIGDKMLPHIKKVVSWVQKAADYINGLSSAQVDNIMKWAGIAAAIGPAIMVFGKVVKTVGAITTTFGKVSKAVGNFGGVLKMLTSPAGIVIGVLAAVALAAVLIIKNWDKVRVFLGNVKKWFADAFKKAGVSVQDFKNKFASIGNSLSAIFGKILDIVGKIGKAFIEGFAGDTETGTKKAGSSTKMLAVTMLKAFNGIITGVDKVLKTFSALISFFTGAFSGNWHSAAETFRHSLYNIFPPNVAGKFVKVFNKALPAIKVVVAGIKGAFKGLVQVLKNLFGNIKTVFDGLVQFVSGVFFGNWKQALKGLGTIAEGVFGGIVNIIKAPFKIIGNVIKNAVNSFKGLSVVKTIFNSLGKVILKVMGKCGVDVEKFTQKIQTIKTRISAILGVLKGVFSAAFSSIGKAVKTASIVIAAIFGKKISSTCSTAKAAVTAFKAVAVAGFKLFMNVVKTVMAFVVPAVAGAFGALVGYVSAGINNIVNIIDGIVRVCKGIIKFVTGVFTGNWKAAWQGVVDIFGGIFDTLAALVKAPINAVIGIINGAIGGINKVGFTVPDWVPKIGGKKFGIDIPTIPMLYKGTNNWQGGAAIIHDRGGEIVDLPKGSRVYPHDKSIEMARREGAGSGITINIQKLADKIEVRSDEDIDRIVEALAYKLKKVAFNTGMA